MNAETRLAVGCAKCSQTGYKGRSGIFELLEVDTTLRGLIHNGHNETQLREQATLNGMTDMRSDGVRYVKQGHTALEELLRVTRD